MPCFYTKIYGSIPVPINPAVMKKRIMPPIIDHNNRVGAFGFSESPSMVNIKIGIMMAEILVYISAPVKYSKKNCNVLSLFYFYLLND